MAKRAVNNIEINYIKDTKDMHNQINDFTGRKLRLNPGCLISKTGKVVMEDIMIC